LVIHARRGTDTVDAAGTQADEERGAVGHPVAERQYPRLKHVDECRPMCPHKRLPGHRTVSARRNTVFFQDPSNRGPTHVMSEVLQGALNPRIAPRRVLRRHAHGERPDLRVHTRAPRAATCVRPLADDQIAMPPENGVRRGDYGHIPKDAASDPVSDSSFGTVRVPKLLGGPRRVG
jgi:hypothetical protein